MTETNPAALVSPRLDFKVCPLCESSDFASVGEGACTQHPLWRPELGETIRWMACSNCEHVFTSGWFRPEAEALLLSSGNAHQIPGAQPIAAIERSRQVAAKIVTTAAHIRGSLEGRWLDVGFGNGALLATADEFGFAAFGLDRRQVCVERLCALGYRAASDELDDHDPAAPYDVISFCDVLEHVPFPRAALRRAGELLASDGVLFLSMPNRQSHVWRVLDERGENPYWSELEHYHNFSRDGLYALCVTEGFQPCHFAVSERYRACMEVCFVRADQPRNAA